MKTYKDFRPTSLDSHITVKGREDWLVLQCRRNRDSNCLDESNFHTALRMLGGECESVEVHRFGHWACGWFDIILVAPASQAHKVAEEIESALANYPILDDTDLSERECAAANEVWARNYSVHDRITYMRAHESEFSFHSLKEMRACVRGTYFAGYASELLARTFGE